MLFGAVHVAVQRGLLVAYSLLLLAVAARLRARGRSLRWHPLALATGAFALLAVLQTVPLPIGLVGALSPRTAEAVRATDALFGVATTSAPLSLAVGATWDAALRWCLLTVGILLLAQVLRRRTARAPAPWVVVGLAAVVLLVALLQTVLGLTRIYGVFAPEHAYAQVGPAGPFVGRNHAAHFLLLGIGAALALLPSARGWRRITLIAVAVLSVVGILADGSRGALLALLVLALAQTVYQWRRHRRGSSALAVLLLAFAVGGMGALESPAVRSFFDLHELGRQLEVSKIRAQGAALPLLAQAPIAGLGADAFGDVQMALAPSPSGHHFSYIENDYLQLLLDFGLLGLAALGAALFAARRSRNRVVEPRDGRTIAADEPTPTADAAPEPSEPPLEPAGATGHSGSPHRRRARVRRRQAGAQAWLALLPFLLYSLVSFALPVPALVLTTAAVFLALGGALRRLPRHRKTDGALVACVVGLATLFTVVPSPAHVDTPLDSPAGLAARVRTAPLDARHLWRVALSGADVLTPAQLDAAAERVADLAGTDLGLRDALASYWAWRGQPLLGWAQLEHVLRLRGDRGPWARDFLTQIPDVGSLLAICEAYPERVQLVLDELHRARRDADALQVALGLPDSPMIVYQRIRAARSLGENELAAAFADQLPLEPVHTAEACRWHAEALAAGGAWDAALAVLAGCLDQSPDDQELLALYVGWALRTRVTAEATRQSVDAYLSHLNTLVGSDVYARRRYHRLRALASARDGECRAADLDLRLTRARDGHLATLPAWAHQACPDLSD